MRYLMALALIGSLACGGGDSNGPGNVNVQGTWVLTFNTSSSCSLGQISLILLADGSSPNEGSFGSYAVTCPAQPPISETSGTIAAYQLSGSNVSVQFSTGLNNEKFLVATASGANMSGTFTWKSTAAGASYNIAGTFTGAKQ